MIPPIDLTHLPGPLQKLASPDGPQKPQEMAAKGVVPGVRPPDLVAVLCVLADLHARPEIARTAAATLAALPETVLSGALGAKLQPAAVDALGRAYATRIDVLEKLFGMETCPIDTVEHLARTGGEAVTELIATNEARILEHPRLVEALYMNKHTRMSTADRLIDLAARNNVNVPGIPAFREAAQALEGELIPEPGEEPTPDDELFQETEQIAATIQKAADDEDTHAEDEEGREVLKDQFAPLWQRLGAMTPSQKIRRAMMGSKEERMLLIRDSNRLVASAVVRSPLIQEQEIQLISRNRNLPEEVLRVIGSSPEWLKSYSIKRNLVENPKTPTGLATKLIPHMREADLRGLAKSKNVTGPVKDAARRQLERRK